MHIGLTPMGELHVGGKALDSLVRQDDKLLVGGRVDEELAAFLLEDLFHLHGHLDGVARELEVEVVSEQGLKLQTNERSLGNDGTVLLLNREEVLVGLTVGEDHCLATERTNLRATNIENIAVACQIGQGDVATFCHQSVAQTCTVNIQWYVVVLADLIDVVQLLSAIKRTQLCWEGDIHQTGEHGVGIVGGISED